VSEKFSQSAVLVRTRRATDGEKSAAAWNFAQEIESVPVGSVATTVHWERRSDKSGTGVAR
jgi:hypothetical protein